MSDSTADELDLCVVIHGMCSTVIQAYFRYRQMIKKPEFGVETCSQQGDQHSMFCTLEYVG
jgi:hypothetical protein